MKKAILIGASSGIGKELAKLLSKEGFELGLLARRVNLLAGLQRELPNKSIVKFMDVSKHGEIDQVLTDLIAEMNGVDTIIVSSGIGHVNKRLYWEREKETIDVNVTGFTKALVFSVNYFMKKGAGHFIGISSIGALRGSPVAPAYNASKAFISNYMEGIRCKIKKTGMKIVITDIKPGFVDTDMAKGEGLFWVMPPETAARQIYQAIRKKKDKAVITRRWAFIALLFKLLPDRLFYKL